MTKAAADHLKHVHLELGGKNAIIVHGRRRPRPRRRGHRLVGVRHDRPALHGGVARDRPRGASTTSCSRSSSRPPRSCGSAPAGRTTTDVGPVINRAALEKIHSLHARSASDEGAKLLTGGEVATGNGLDEGFFYRPTMFADVEPQMRIAQEEIFGPTTALIRVRDFDEAIARRERRSSYGLSSSIFTRDVNRAFRAMRDLAGRDHVHQRRHDRRRGAPARSAARRTPATATARPARPRSTSSPSGSRSTSTTRASCRRPRSTTRERREPEARRLRSARGARRRARRALRRGRRPDRRLRALLLVHGGDGHVPRRRGDEPDASASRGARSASPSCGSRRSSRRSAQDDVVAALRAAHPYEEPAFDVYALAVKARLFTDGGARGNPGPAAYGYVLEAEDGTVLAARRRGDRRRDEQRRRVPRPASPACEAALELRRRRARGRLRLGAARQADARRVQGQERGAARALSLEAARLARQLGRVALHGTSAASTTSSPTGSSTRRSTRPPESPRLYWSRSADVAQLARASACHAEGRGFESHHPL